MAQTGRNYAAPLLVVGCVVFGLGSLIVKFVDVGSYAIAFWRLAIAAVIFWLLARFFGQKLPKNRKAVTTALISGVFLAFDLALWHESIHSVGPGISTLLNSLQIFFLSAIGYFCYRERLSPLQILSLVLAVCGVALIASPEFGHNSAAAWGFISGITSGAMLAMSMVYIRKTHQIEQTALFPLMMLLSIGGMASLIVPAFVFDGGSLYPTSLRDIGLVLIYGAIMQCFAWGLIAYAVPLLSLSLTGLLLLSEPVAALAIDYFWLDKPINTLQWGGAVLTLLAIYLGSLKSKSA
ncbi:DMT family transporter [Neisseria animalis]|uniref:DMT family transporter n=1 Tax=Neisseria animalis TaxID=492 RepID=A0A5P3MTM9_NEIAN|nr:DMT family transporter [Neisseria animalis]QEY24888.1 DMT family transporter [Neisseria animalis]ROW32418.1 DMT family transporter [Neisseria animalis]VEE08097.1 integral membrane protein [Neisseria animalis]